VQCNQGDEAAKGNLNYDVEWKSASSEVLLSNTNETRINMIEYHGSMARLDL